MYQRILRVFLILCNPTRRVCVSSLQTTSVHSVSLSRQSFVLKFYVAVITEAAAQLLFELKV